MNERLKAVIFCGGKGTRIREFTEQSIINKHMIPIGDKPIVWHLMKLLYHNGIKDFILCLGIGGHSIRSFFKDYRWLANDSTIQAGSKDLVIHTGEQEDWNITFVDTGVETKTADRLSKVKKYLEGEERFLVTYGDGLANVNINELVEFHKKMNKIATITGAHGFSKYGMIEFNPTTKTVISLKEKPKLHDYINIGFMIFEKKIFDFLEKDKMIEDVMIKLIDKGGVAIFPFEGEFNNMDTYKDYEELNKLWDSGKAHWKIWKE
jgi:glucose-1-phosphate cytidylyltransferase